jgi:transglutaminase-like putative cysteine protease
VSERTRTPAAIALPRPFASYAIVLLSAAALALTGQVASIALGVHAVAVVVALRTRLAPRAWQRSAWILNAGLLLASAFAAGLWLRGALALVALAHFTHLAQALQLLDARPRRSDFLLVALALFQIILAANLTDSFLFPPLLLAFLIATVWTLIQHTLWMEAMQAGETGVAQRAFAPRLWRTTLTASAACVALAFGIFLVLPRLQSGSLASGSGLGGAAAGFSDRVSLGDIGRIRSDPSVALRVETVQGVQLPPERAYWRGLAFDTFDGRQWSITPPARQLLPGSVDFGIRVSRTQAPPDLVQRVLREPVASGVLFGAGSPIEVAGAIGRLERDPNGGLYAPESTESRVHYTVESHVATPDVAALRADRSVPPAPGGERFLALPALAPEIAALALQIAPPGASDADRTRAVETWLRHNGRYSDTPPREVPGDPRSPIERFLLESTEAHCEYFASAMVVLLRSIGVSARLVNGFAGGRANEFGGFVELSRADAHAWVEVHYERAGWVAYDPTPPDLRLRVAQTSWVAQMQDLAAAAEHWWFRHVVEFDRSTQLRAVRSGWMAWKRWREDQTEGELAPDRSPAERWRGISLDDWWRPALGAAVLAVGALALLYGRRRRAQRGSLPAAYAEALALLERQRGLVRARNLPARDFARRSARALPPAAAAAFWSLTEAYLAERFGGHRARESRRALRALRDSLRA